MSDHGAPGGGEQGAPAGSHAKPLLLLCLFVVGLNLNLAVLGFVPALVGVDLKENPTGYVYVVLSAQAALSTAFLCLLWYVLRKAGQGLGAVGLRFRSLRRDMLFGVWTYLQVLPLIAASVLVVAFVLTRLGVSLQRSMVHEMAAESARHAASALAFAAMASVVAPVLEETLFRGLLYTSLRGWLGFWPAAVVSAACFAMMHVGASRLPTAILGLALAWTYERSGSLVPAIAAHALHNALLYGALLLVSR